MDKQDFLKFEFNTGFEDKYCILTAHWCLRNDNVNEKGVINNPNKKLWIKYQQIL